MIIDAILAVLLGLLLALFSLFPSWTLPDISGWASGGVGSFEECPVAAACSFGQMFGFLGAWVDVGLIGTAIAIVLPFALVAATVHLAIWVYRHFPGKAS